MAIADEWGIGGVFLAMGFIPLKLHQRGERPAGDVHFKKSPRVIPSAPRSASPQDTVPIVDHRCLWIRTGGTSCAPGELHYRRERARGGMHLEECPVSLPAVGTHSPQEARAVTDQTPQRTGASLAFGELHHGRQFPGGGINLEDTSAMLRPTKEICAPPGAVAIADQGAGWDKHVRTKPRRDGEFCDGGEQAGGRVKLKECPREIRSSTVRAPPEYAPPSRGQRGSGKAPQVGTALACELH